MVDEVDEQHSISVEPIILPKTAQAVSKHTPNPNIAPFPMYKYVALRHELKFCSLLTGHRDKDGRIVIVHMQ